MNKTCKNCNEDFKITPEDLKFYDKISPIFNGVKYEISAPTLCPDCRQQRRLSFRNERKLYHRKCDLTGKQIISIYSPNKPYKVYNQEEWWSDKWDPTDYGQEFDFNRTFFDQFNKLMLAVPRVSLFAKECENCEYTNHSSYGKDCYLHFNFTKCRNCYYGSFMANCNDCIDCQSTLGSEYCYNLINCKKCYKLSDSMYCENSSDSQFLFNCIGCKDCFLCANIRNKQYFFKNKSYSAEEYKNIIMKFKIDNSDKYIESKKIFFEFLKNDNYFRCTDIKNSENCTGDLITNSKNCKSCYYIDDGEDTMYCYDCFDIKDSSDCYETAVNIRNLYECHASNGSQLSHFLNFSYESNNIIYCDSVHNSKNCFGCSNIHNMQYCILNKQYSKEEYEILVPKIIDHMRSTGEWGEFFPISISPFGYNETVANEYAPLTKEQAISKAYKWQEDDSSSIYQGVKYEIPQNIKDVKDDILNAILVCEISGRPYKIIPQELKFYREMNLPIPRICPDERHKARMKLRNPRKLFDRNCMKCNTEIKTTYSPDRPEIVYCEECYLSTVY